MHQNVFAIAIYCLLCFVVFSSATKATTESRLLVTNAQNKEGRHYTRDILLGFGGHERDTYAEMIFSLPFPFELHAQIFVNLTNNEIIPLRAVCHFWWNYINDMIVSLPIAPDCPFSEMNLPNLKQLAMYNVAFRDITKVSVLRQLTEIKLFNPKNILLSEGFDIQIFENLESIEIYKLGDVLNLSFLNELPKFKSLKFIDCTWVGLILSQVKSFPEITHFSICGNKSDVKINIDFLRDKFPRLKTLEIIIDHHGLDTSFEEKLPNLEHLILIGRMHDNDVESDGPKFMYSFLPKSFKNITHLEIVNFQFVDFDEIAKILNDPDCKINKLTITTNIPNGYVKVYRERNCLESMNSKNFVICCHSNVKFIELDSSDNEVEVTWPKQVKHLNKDQ